ncbi:MAG: Hsp20/alpha crystallin family protein [Ardenticatenaceae bacterium]|nr:Hsp20/alpha crystallin family protein [Ardenticatenaceae bacterium]MCB8949528.1 Hsp20/alpha crystallin family protein [Ardenticatenaceae bacterium]
MNTMIRWNPFGEMARMRNEIDRLFEDAFNAPVGKWERNSVWGFPLDVTENEDTFTVKAAVPGMNPDDLEITITDNVLTIKGETQDEEVRDDEKVHLRERRFGSFMRSISLPTPVESDNVEANMENGVLTLQIPKAEAVKPKRIAVHAGNGATVLEG